MGAFEQHFGVSDEWIERSCADIEDPRKDLGGGGPIFRGSPLDSIGKKRVTVVYDAADAQRVAALAKSRGVKPSEVYRAAVIDYLSANLA